MLVHSLPLCHSAGTGLGRDKQEEQGPEQELGEPLDLKASPWGRLELTAANRTLSQGEKEEGGGQKTQRTLHLLPRQGPSSFFQRAV